MLAACVLLSIAAQAQYYDPGYGTGCQNAEMTVVTVRVWNPPHQGYDYYRRLVWYQGYYSYVRRYVQTPVCMDPLYNNQAYGYGIQPYPSIVQPYNAGYKKRAHHHRYDDGYHEGRRNRHR